MNICLHCKRPVMIGIACLCFMSSAHHSEQSFEPAAEQIVARTIHFDHGHEFEAEEEMRLPAVAEAFRRGAQLSEHARAFV